MPKPPDSPLSAVTLPRHAEIWLWPYVLDRTRKAWSHAQARPRRVWLMIADHFEPFRGTRDLSVARERVLAWRRAWPEIAKRHQDSTGASAQYTFFYPQEEYHPELLELLAEIVREGYGDVEVHIHHDSGGPNGGGQQEFMDRMSGFLEVLRNRHGLLREQNGKRAFGFIHGNWALDNSRPDGRCCGLNNEITLLRDLGCYADFTMPCGPHASQCRTLNTIYWATDDPGKPKSYDRGQPVLPGRPGHGDLLMIPGPFGLRWGGRLTPHLEIGELASHNGPSVQRVKRWLELAPRIGSDLFIKLFAHGAFEKNMTELLGGGLQNLLCLLKDAMRRPEIDLRYVNGWGMRQAVENAWLQGAGHE
jgi:hypothetical protein